MDFNLTEEQESFRESVIRFAQKELNQDLIDRDESHEFDREAWNRVATLGIHGLPVPEEYGGQAADPLTIVIAMEALGYGCRDNGLIFSINAHIWSAITPILRFGSVPQKQRYLPGLCDGSLIGVQGMSEPGAGSDAFGAMATTAIRSDGGWILNGVKTWITNAPVADVFVVFAVSDSSKGWAGLSAFLVDRDAPGLSVGKPFKKMGLRTSPMSELVFDDCYLPEDSLLGKEGNGMMIFNHSMDWERSSILAHSVGTMQRQVEEAVAFAQQRVQFGQPIGKFQAVSHKIVDMKVRLEASRLLLYNLAWQKGQGRRTDIEAAITKLFLSESWVQSGLDAIQIHGAYGYMTESGIERDLRDAIAGRIYSGTSEIQKNLIAGQLGL